ncbi:Pentatricopeptide repeat-containing protein [Thalictrum thalictroides]|uniref:Pentatricopeptide repeat-containing protein n=1 Tax=Thalictrum thalictroides TaxID=46969 RepID=A0A7J6WR49_THATH|nr:Pentatricopeptide repeat-containing protein [Thalictrum thalictroides]
MMKLCYSSNALSQTTLSRVCKVLMYSTSQPKTKRDTLYNRISPLGDPRVSVVPVLDQWIEEGNNVDHFQLQGLIKQLKTFRRYKQALEISLWMTDRRHHILSARDNVVRLELIAKMLSNAKAVKKEGIKTGIQIVRLRFPVILLSGICGRSYPMAFKL